MKRVNHFKVAKLQTRYTHAQWGYDAMRKARREGILTRKDGGEILALMPNAFPKAYKAQSNRTLAVRAAKEQYDRLLAEGKGRAVPKHASGP